MAPVRESVDTGVLEARYAELNQQLLQRLNRLQYLDQLRQVQALSDEDITQRYHEASTQWGEGVTPEIMRQFVEVKTQVVGQYLNQVGPLVASAAAPAGTPSAHIRQLTNEVYGPKGPTATVTASYDRYVAATKRFDELVEATASEVARLAPQLREAERRQRQIDTETANTSAARIDGIKATFGDAATTMADDLRLTIAEWRRLRVACDLVPMVVLMLLVDWTRLPELLAVVEGCQRHGERLAALERVVLVDTVLRYLAPALLALDFDLAL